MTAWDIYDDPSRNVSECLDCEYEGTDHAESDDFIADDETGEREVFCPDCKSSLYFVKQRGKKMRKETLKIENAKHAYDVEVSTTDSVEVWANNRTQAASMVKKVGYDVRSVNMIG